MALAVKGKDQNGPMERGVVASRRTVVVDGMPQGPGTIIELEAMEIRRLRSLGFLTTPGVPEIHSQAATHIRGPMNGVVTPV